MRLTRRDFLKLSASSAVVFAGCAIPQKELLVQSPVQAPEDLVTGLEAWYASLCRQCPAGCGIIVRVVEGRAKKIEGNPFYPINQGKLCARGQAGLQALYHPDRIRGPLRRSGQRFTGELREISWDEALTTLVGRLKELRERGENDSVVLLTEPLRGHLALVVNRFVRAYGAQHLAHEPLEQTTLRAAVQRLFGQDILPEFDLEHAHYLLSFSADFLETWLSPVRYGRGYGEFRQGRPGKRGTFVQIEPRFSLTAANADEWVPIRPGTEGVLALSMAQVIISEGLGDPQAARALTGGAGAAALEAYRPEKVAQVTGVAAQRITSLARSFARERPSLALAGGSAAAHSNGLFNVSAALSLNFLVGSVGRPGGVLLNPSSPLPEVPVAAPATPFAEWQRLAARLRSAQPQPVNLLLVQCTNPVYTLAAGLDFRASLEKVPFLVSFASFLDETATLADLILPDHVYLESWGDDIPEPGSGYQTLGLQQPVVNPLFHTRSFADVLLLVARELGGATQQALPWDTFRDVLREGARQLHRQNRGSVPSRGFESFWVRALQQGGWWDPQAKSTAAAPPPPPLPREPVLPSFDGGQEEYPFHLLVFPSLSLTDGRGAHLPWLQAAPDPLTTVVWQTWLEINPSTARELGLQENDVVVVASPRGQMEVPVYLHPAIPPQVVAMPAGQGHLAFGRYAERRGVNPLAILAPLTDRETGGLAWAATRVKLIKTGRRQRLPKMEGSVPPVQPPDVPIVQVTRT